jgi:hypothetical protein
VIDMTSDNARDDLERAAAQATLGLDNKAAWLAIQDYLRAADVAGSVISLLRHGAWVHRQRLRAAERAEKAQAWRAEGWLKKPVTTRTEQIQRRLMESAARSN